MNILESVITKSGNKIELIGCEGESQVLIIGVFHGDEPQGKYLIDKYLEYVYSYPPLEGGSESLISGRGNIAKHHYANYMISHAKELRNNATIHEQILWKYLKQHKFMNLKFRRQQPIGNYIVDFVCCSPKIIIELDGSQHIENKNYDEQRDKYLSDLGFKIIRIWNNDIISNIEGVLSFIKQEIENPTRKSKISTLPQGEGRLLFIPCLNPDGLQNNTRTNANGVDLNRNFPTKNWGGVNVSTDGNPECQDSSLYYGGESAGSEIETKFVIDIIEKYKPKLILTLHAPYKIVNYDGPAQDIAQKISEIINYPVEPSIGYPTPGSFGTYCGVERNIPIITLELDEKIPVEQLEQPVFEIFDMLRTMYLV
ncbi:DUF2817 domain-containing protein [bacterium]|nr:DUF2817 domain-containing protein [bacterium]